MLGVNCVYWAGIHACATVDAGVSVNNALATLFADGVHWAGVFTSCAVGAIVGNGMSHGTTSLKIMPSPRKTLGNYHRGLKMSSKSVYRFLYI